MNEPAVDESARMRTRGEACASGGEPPAISARDLSKRYSLETLSPRRAGARLFAPLARLLGRERPAGPRREIWALDGATFDVARGERLAVIGRNGAGKSTLLKLLSRIVKPTRGEARIRGRLTSLLEVGIGFNNKLTGRENVFLNASLHGVGKRETAERLEEILEFSGIDPRFLDVRVKHYSSGMRTRLAFSVAAHLDPDILLLDEVLAVGDLAFQEKCLERVEGMMKEKRTLVFVSHDMSSVTRFCQRALWLEQGRIVLDGPAGDVAAAYTEDMRKAIASRRCPPGGREEAAPDRRAEPVPEVDLETLELAPDGTIDEPPAARFAALRVIARDGREVRAVTADQGFGIELTYDVTRDGKVVLPSARFYDAGGILMFTAVYTDEVHVRKPKGIGRYVSVVWVPPHLLNVGPVRVSVGLSTPVSGRLQRHEVLEHALSFEVFEAPFGAPSARGPYREIKGAVRPLLEWETRMG
jgi:lipopolysaccharide transport system ATP-binding protein